MLIVDSGGGSGLTAGDFIESFRSESVILIGASNVALRPAAAGFLHSKRCDFLYYSSFRFTVILNRKNAFIFIFFIFFYLGIFYGGIQRFCLILSIMPFCWKIS